MPRPFDWPDPFLREVQELRTDSARRAERINGLLSQHRLAEAEAALDGLLADASEDGEALLLLARLRLQQRRCDEAETVLQRHLAVRPDSLNGFVQLGLARSCLSRWADAAAAFAQAVALKPDFAQAHYNLGLARARSGDSSGAILSWREAIRCAPGDPSPWVALTEEYVSKGRLDEARVSLERLERIAPSHPAIAPLRERLGQGR